LKQSELFDEIVAFFRQALSLLPDKRTGKNSRYGMEDAGLSAFSVFFTQTPSFLAYQRSMEGSKGKSNAQSLFEVHQIPSGNHIRRLLDLVKPEEVFPVFEEILKVLKQQGQLESVRFILVCRPESHTTLYEHLEGIAVQTLTTKHWTGKVEETDTYRFPNNSS